MRTVVVGSTRPSTGKTSMVLGMTRALGVPCGYIKPFGDRLMYRKKRLWDYDAAVAASVLELEHNPEDITIGFEHAKLTYMFDEASTRAKLQDMAGKVGAGRDRLFVEAGRDLRYGTSVHLDALAMARSLSATLLLVAGDDPEIVLDDLAFLRRYVAMHDIAFAGVIINQIKEPADFEASYRARIEALDVRILGVVPFEAVLSYRSLRNISEILFGKVIAAEENLDRVIKHILIGATSVSEAITRELTRREGALIITSGDRSDVVVAALQANAAGIVLTNNFLPSPSIVAQAAQRGIPMMLVSHDTFQAAKIVDEMEPLVTAADHDKIELLGRLVKEHVDLSAI